MTQNFDFVAYLKTLKPEDWNKMATEKWTVKDVVAHMVGWEKRDPEIIRKTWETKRLPWWMTAQDEYDAFNRENVGFYKDYTPDQLIAEWEMWQKKVGDEINRIGYKNLETRPDLFGWLLDKEGGGNGSNDDPKESHYEHHYKQIKHAVGNVQS